MCRLAESSSGRGLEDCDNRSMAVNTKTDGNDDDSGELPVFEVHIGWFSVPAHPFIQIVSIRRTIAERQVIAGLIGDRDRTPKQALL